MIPFYYKFVFSELRKSHEAEMQTLENMLKETEVNLTVGDSCLDIPEPYLLGLLTHIAQRVTMFEFFLSYD